MPTDPTPEERRKALLQAAREHREESARRGNPMMHVVHVNRGLRDVALLFGYDIQPLVAAAELIIGTAHADSAALINDTWGRLPPPVKRNPLTGQPLPGEMTDEEFEAYVRTNPITGEPWKHREMQALVDRGLKEKAGLREFLMVMYFARPSVPSAGRPWQWMMPYDTRGREIIWEKTIDQGEARMGGWIYRRFMAAFRAPDVLDTIREHPIGAALAEGLSDEAAQAHVDAAALKLGLARTEPGEILGMVPFYEDDHPDRKAVLEKSLEPEQLQKDVSSWYTRLRGGGELMADEPAWCEVHQHHKWCEHNGGAMDATGAWGPRPDGVFTPSEPYDESMTNTLSIPFPKYIHKPETEYDTVIVRVPDEFVSPPPASPGLRPEVAMHLLRATAESQVAMQNTCREAQWWITRDPEVVKQRGEGDRCPTCLAGMDQALTAMRNHPGMVLAVGRLSWCG